MSGTSRLSQAFSCIHQNSGQINFNIKLIIISLTAQLRIYRLVYVLLRETELYRNENASISRANKHGVLIQY